MKDKKKLRRMGYIIEEKIENEWVWADGRVFKKVKTANKEIEKMKKKYRVTELVK